MNPDACRAALCEYVRREANPPDKFSHQARLYHLARQLAGHTPYDDDVVFAAAWLHDLGVFIGHRPEEPAALAAWDHVAYVCRRAPALLAEFGFPAEKTPAILDVIRTHLPVAEPGSFEGWLIHDADILEQLGAVSILRTVSKVGRDTRFVRFSDALAVLRRNADELPARLHLATARDLAQPRLAELRRFLAAAETEADGLAW